MTCTKCGFNIREAEEFYAKQNQAIQRELAESNEYARKLNLKIADLCKVIVELTAAGNCVEGDKMNLAMAIKNVGGTANVKWSTDNWNNAKDWDRRKNGTI